MIAAAGVDARAGRNPVRERGSRDARVAQIVQSMADEAGFDVKLLPHGNDHCHRALPERQFRGLYRQLERARRSGPDTLSPSSSARAGQNVNKYCNKDLDAILNAGPRARPTRPSARRSTTKRPDIYLTALSSIPLYHPNWFFAARKSVGGIVMVPDGLLRLVGVKPVNDAQRRAPADAPALVGPDCPDEDLASAPARRLAADPAAGVDDGVRPAETAARRPGAGAGRRGPQSRGRRVSAAEVSVQRSAPGAIRASG